MMNIVADNYSILQVLSRIGIPLGFGDATVEEVCSGHGVDCFTFLSLVNFVLSGKKEPDPQAISRLSVPTLVRFLQSSHTYFLEYFLPSIREKLLKGIRLNMGDVSFLIIRFFDEYYEEVRRHMEYEESDVFPYVEKLLRGDLTGPFRISTYSEHHDQAAEKLHELKKLILRYCPSDAEVNRLNDALYDIFRCEDELESHCLMEDHIFVPAIELLEANTAHK